MHLSRQQKQAPAKKSKQAKPKATKKEEPAKKEEAPAENGDPKTEEVKTPYLRFDLASKLMYFFHIIIQINLSHLMAHVNLADITQG